MFFYLSWYDTRLSMPALWNALQVPELFIDITQLVSTPVAQGIRPLIWLPDVVFPDSQAAPVTTQQYIRLYPGGEIRYMRHIIISLLQSSFSYENYPHDEQKIIIRFYSLTMYSSQLMFVAPTEAAPSGIDQPGFSFANNYNGDVSFAQNPLWNLVDSSLTYTSMAINQYFGSRSTCLITITVSRKQSGLVNRMAVPVLFLVLLAGMVFWADLNDRVGTTLTVILSVAAFYIVIFSNVPMVGYLTSFDSYILGMFVILFGACVLHQSMVRIETADKLQKWPLRKISVRFLECFGRTLVIPVIILNFVVQFTYFRTDSKVCGTVIAMILVFICIILTREWPSVMKVIKSTRIELLDKFESSHDVVSKLEIFTFNLIVYHIFSTSLNHFHAQKHAAENSGIGDTVVSGLGIELQNVSKEWDAT